MTYKPKRQYKSQGEFGGLPREIAKMLGMDTARAMADYMQHGSQGKFGIVEDDFRCDADSPQKLADIVRMHQIRQNSET